LNSEVNRLYHFSCFCSANFTNELCSTILCSNFKEIKCSYYVSRI